MRLIDADKLREFTVMGDTMPNFQAGWNAALNYVEMNAPTVEAEEVKHGEWFVYYDEDCPQDSVWECSVCGYLRLLDECFSTNYCPNCGAKMKGDDDEQRH